MNECYGKKFILNGELQPVEMFDNSLVYEGDSIYEVIRIMKCNPVFFDDHMERLSTSAELQGRRVLADKSVIRRDILNLARADRKKEVNIKIVFNYKDGKTSYLVYYIEPLYPSQDQYLNGVKGILYRAERKNPESKVINHKLRSQIYHRLINEGGYEALLVNDENLITEGSRSNIFFLKGDTLYTAPDDMILNGITRKQILLICEENGIRVEYQCINANDLSDYDAVFMTGTSPMVLPFRCIDDKFFRTDYQLIEELRSFYLLKVEASIRKFRLE